MISTQFPTIAVADFQATSGGMLRTLITQDNKMAIGIPQAVKSEYMPPPPVVSENDQELKDHVKKFYSRIPAGKKLKISMQEYRHVIPLLVQNCFDMREHSIHKKVKGMWNHKPQNWPAEIPFCDPNNSKHGGEHCGKPKKDVVTKMYSFLLREYLKKTGQLADFPLPDVKVGGTEHGYNRTPQNPPSSIPRALQSPCPTPQALPSLPSPSPLTTPSLSSPSPRALQSPSPAPSYTSSICSIQDTVTPGGNIVTTPDSSVEEGWEEYSEDYDPISDLIRRIRGKINLVQEKKSIPDQDIGFLNVIFDLLKKLRKLIEDNLSKRFFLEAAHDFEATVDCAIYDTLHKVLYEKWQDFEVYWQKKAEDKENFRVGIIEKKLDMVTKATVMSEIEPEQQNVDLEDLLDKLNIRPSGENSVRDLVKYDCVEVRFMKAPTTETDDVVHNTADEDLFKKMDFGDNFLDAIGNVNIDAINVNVGVEEESYAELLMTDAALETDTEPSDVISGKTPVDVIIRDSVVMGKVEELFKLPTAESGNGTTYTTTTTTDTTLTQNITPLADLRVDDVTQQMEQQTLYSPVGNHGNACQPESSACVTMATFDFPDIPTTSSFLPVREAPSNQGSMGSDLNQALPRSVTPHLSQPSPSGSLPVSSTWQTSQPSIQKPYQPSQPITQPSQPITQPSLPSPSGNLPVTSIQKPYQPSHPSTQPSQPITQPSQPITQPSQPITQPSQPILRGLMCSGKKVGPGKKTDQPATKKMRLVGPEENQVVSVAQTCTPVQTVTMATAQPTSPVQLVTMETMSPVHLVTMEAMSPAQLVTMETASIMSPVPAVIDNLCIASEPSAPQTYDTTTVSQIPLVVSNFGELSESEDETTSDRKPDTENTLKRKWPGDL